MKKYVYIIVLLLLGGTRQINAQSLKTIKEVLLEIENNNTELKALREKSNVQKLENKVLNNLENPEIQMTHKPSRRAEPRNTEVEVSQSFDFPTAYNKRKAVINSLNQQEDYLYQIRRTEIYAEVYILLTNAIYFQEKLDYTLQRNLDAEKMYSSYSNLLKIGQIDILEYNKTKLNLLESRKDLELCRIELQTIQDNLKSLNGGISVEELPKIYTLYTLPTDFETWYTSIRNKNPQLLLAGQKWKMGKQQESLVKALNLPKLRVGYVAEIDPSQTKSGFLVGVSIPLWTGRNKLKASKMQTSAMFYDLQDQEIRFKNLLRINYDKSQRYLDLLNEYQNLTVSMENVDLLKKSLELGRINVLTYLQELLIYYQSVDSFLEIQRDYNLSLLELNKWEL